MMNNRRYFFFALLIADLSLLPTATRADSYDLGSVTGMQGFSGSVGARGLLAKNGFVVSDPTFKQIFEPYIKSPQIERSSPANPEGVSLPSFITPDSAWDTYHVLLEEGVKEMELIQSQRLLKFSQQLLSAAREQHVDADLLLFASVGLALQDKQHRQILTGEEKRIVDALRSGSDRVPVPIGFNLSAAQFHAQSFYTQSPQLSDYFAARQWYATVVFRLANVLETKSAVQLARLVNENPQLLALWKQLSEPFNTFLATAEDGTVPQYFEAAASVSGNAAGNISDAQLAEIQKKLESQMPLPRVNDQTLTPEQLLHFGNETRGFRLLPPRRLPSAQCFQDTVYPKIPNRYYPSGLDFMAASPALRSAAAVRALQNEFGQDTADLILKADCGPMPDSLHGESMQLLAKLQQPLPSDVPAPMRTEAWQDLQLWTQLGAWAQQRHTWALHVKMTVGSRGGDSPPQGMVAPYPDFFAGLATLTRRTAEAFRQTGLGRQFDVKSVSEDLLHLLQSSKSPPPGRESEELSAELEQLAEFENRYYELHHAPLTMENDLEDLARRGSAGQTTSADIETLRLFFNFRPDTVRLIENFAPVCDRLAELAKKSLHGEPLTDDDAKWIENYGITLAGLHFYYSNSYDAPRDDFPIVTRVFFDPIDGKMLYAGLARPQALYIIIPKGKSLQLYRGAVMTYREFVHPDKDLLDDDAWRDRVAKGEIPPAPPFTKSFYAETSVAELLQKLPLLQPGEMENYDLTRDTLWQIEARATEEDLPRLVEFFTRVKSADNEEVAYDLAYIIARLPWKSEQPKLMDLIASPDITQANATARIFAEHSAPIDISAFATRFPKESIRTRRFYCAILSELPQQTDATRQMLLQALHDESDGVRWQAALAIGKAGRNDDQARTALLAAMNDTNELVGAAAVHALAILKATNTSPLLLERLTTQVQMPVRDSGERSSQEKAILADLQHEGNIQSILDVDAEAMEIEMQVRKMVQRSHGLPMHNYNLADALISALGEMKYTPAVDELLKLDRTTYGFEASVELNRIAPDRAADQLLKTALDKQADSYAREQALIALARSSATDRVRELIPLLDDTTPIVYPRPLPAGWEWRICDRTSQIIAIMLGWEDRRHPRQFTNPQSRQKRDDLMARVRDWAKENTEKK